MLVVPNQVFVQILFIYLERFLILLLFGFKHVDCLPDVITALYGPAVWVFCGIENGDSTTALFGLVISLIFQIHMLLHEIAAFIFEVFTI